MAVITRLARLFRADVHAVLDRIEEPDVLLRQAVRDMEEECARDAQRGALIAREEEQLAARLAEIDRGLGDADEALDVCLRSGTDALARAVIRRQLEARQLRKGLAARAQGLADDRAALARRLEEKRRRLDGMRQKAAVLADEAPRTADQDWASPMPVVRDEDVEVALLREKERRAVP
jgi:phage shock protein A